MYNYLTCKAVNHQAQWQHTVLETTVLTKRDHHFITFPFLCIILQITMTDHGLHIMEFIQYCSNKVSIEINKDSQMYYLLHG